jgi:hypothetical protein
MPIKHTLNSATNREVCLRSLLSKGVGKCSVYHTSITCKARYTLSVKLSDFTVWCHI